MLNFLAPKFLKNIDQKLLLHYPILWISKIHYVLYYTLIILLITIAIAFVTPLNLSSSSDADLYYIVFCVVSVVLLCVWIYKNAIFNVEKEHGNRKYWDEYKVFALYFISIFLLSSFIYIHSFIYNTRVANVLSNDELVHDINVLNVAHPFFSTNLYDFEEVQYLKSDSVLVKTDSAQNYNYNDYFSKYNINNYLTWNKFIPYTIIDDSLDFIGIWNSKEQQVKFNMLRKNDALAMQAIQDYLNVLKKHKLAEYVPSTQSILKRYKKLTKQEVTSFDQFNVELDSYEYFYVGQTYEMESILRNICKAKQNKIFIYSAEFNLFMFYLIFYITLLFMLFKNVRWQQFLTSIVTIIVLALLLLIFSMFLSFGTYMFDFSFSTGAIILYAVALFVFFSFLFYPTKYSVFKSICMQIVYIFMPLFFMFVVYYIDDNSNVFLRHSNYYSAAYYKEAEPFVSDTSVDAVKEESAVLNDKALNEKLQEAAIMEASIVYHRHLYDLLFWGALIFGIVFHVLFFMVFMKQQFVKMLALPSNN